MSGRIAVGRAIEILKLTRTLSQNFKRNLGKGGSSTTYTHWTENKNLQPIINDLINHSQLPKDIVDNNLTTHISSNSVKGYVNILLPNEIPSK